MERWLQKLTQARHECLGMPSQSYVRTNEGRTTLRPQGYSRTESDNKFSIRMRSHCPQIVHFVFVFTWYSRPSLRVSVVCCHHLIHHVLLSSESTQPLYSSMTTFLADTPALLASHPFWTFSKPFPITCGGGTHFSFPCCSASGRYPAHMS